MKKVLFILSVGFYSQVCEAETFTATVVDVHDGDTARVQRIDGTVVRVRFVFCDTPEIDQPHGIEARDFVSEMILGEEVTVESNDVDQHGRALGEIFIDGQSVNKEVIEKGHGWWFYHFHDDVALGHLEAAAKSQKLGLWQSETPIFPRNWRRGARVNGNGGGGAGGGNPGGGTSPGPDSSVFIMAMMPNPSGEDTNNETVILANSTNAEVSIDQWRLEDDDDGAFTLSGSIPASGSLTVRLDSSLLLGNGGDDVTLRDDSGDVVHELSYGGTQAGRFDLAAE